MSHAYRFGEFLLDPAKRTLVRDGLPVPLQPKAFELIVYLIEQRERAVGRDELIAAVWGKADITDNALGQAMLQARRALDDSGDGGQRVIATVPRFGYRWLAPVTSGAIAASADAGDLPPPPSSTAAMESALEAATGATMPASKERLPHWWLAALAACAIAAIGWFGMRSGQHPQRIASASSARSSLAVLPAGVDAPASAAWVRLGVMDLVAHRLRAAGQAIVPSDNVVGLARRFSDANGGIDTAALLREAEADALVEIHARLLDGHWRVDLVIPARGRHAEGNADDVIVAARIASDRLASSLGLRPPLDADATDNLAALLQQVRAAILGEQLDHARALLLAADDETRARPEARYHLAEIDFRSGRLDDAARAFEELLAQARADDLPDLRPRILNALANIAYQRNDYAAVAAWSDRALQMLAHRDDAGESGRALIGRASARQGQHRYDEALADFAQARIALEAAGDPLALARVDAYQGLLEVNRERFAEAVPVLLRAAAKLQAFDAVVEELHARVGIAMADLATLEPAVALAQCERIDELARRVSDPRRKHYAELVCIDAQIANGHLGDAAARLRILRAQAQPPEQTLLRQSRVQVHRVAATLAQSQRQPEIAASEAAAALALPSDHDSADEHAALLLQLARAQRALGRADALKASGLEASSWAEGHSSPAARMYAALTAAEEALARDDSKAADHALSTALVEADASRVPAHLLAAAQAMAHFLLDRGDLARASTVVGRIAAWSGRSYDAALLRLRLHHALRQAGPWRNALQQAEALAGERIVPSPLRRLPWPLRLDESLPNGAQTPR